jgi:hypothetical protein
MHLFILLEKRLKQMCRPLRKWRWSTEPTEPPKPFENIDSPSELNFVDWHQGIMDQLGHYLGVWKSQPVTKLPLPELTIKISLTPPGT